MGDMVLDDLSLVSEIPKLEIKIDGDGYEGMVDATTAAIILDIQTKIYQLAAVGLFGHREDTRRLSVGMRRALLVKFEIKPGCTEMLAELAPSFAEAIKPVFEKMTPQELLDFSKFLVFAFIGWNLGGKALEAYSNHVTSKAQGEHERAMLKQHADALLIAAGKIGEEASVFVAKTTTGATNVKFGRREFNEQDLNEIRERAPRTKKSNLPVTKHYIVEKVDVKKRPVIYMDLLQVPGEVSVRAQYTEDEQESLYSDNTTEILCIAAAKGETIQLDVLETVSSEGELRKVQVIGVHDESN